MIFGISGNVGKYSSIEGPLLLWFFLTVYCMSSFIASDPSVLSLQTSTLNALPPRCHMWPSRCHAQPLRHQQDATYWLTGVTGHDWCQAPPVMPARCHLLPVIPATCQSFRYLPVILVFASHIPVTAVFARHLQSNQYTNFSQSKYMLIVDSAIATLCWPEWCSKFYLLV